VSAARNPPPAWFGGAVTAAVVTAGWSAAERRATRDGHWRRRNFRDRDVSLLLGPVIGAGAAAGLLAAGPRARRTALVVVSGAAVIGAYDDRYGDSHARGLGGHARALRQGRVTTGMVKLVSLVAVAAVGSARRYRRPVDVALGTVLVAGMTNLVNLFDLRPGRAAKASLMFAAVLGQSGEPEVRASAAVAAAAAASALPADLGERAMLGDCGAGTLGALLGWSAAAGGSRRRRAMIAAGVVGLTLASERVSFSAVIDRQPLLRAVDQLGRQPA
jgi:UDP-N-acetylmuramyl pentapeptide phosphotransferase/UDP-N-acetylglucosamine-1-phosphate transferase